MSRKVTKLDLIELSHQINQLDNQVGIVFWSEFKCDENEYCYQLIIFTEDDTASKTIYENVDNFHKIDTMLNFVKELFVGTKSLQDWWQFCEYK